MICCLLFTERRKQRSLVMTCYRWLLFISISVSVVMPFCSSFNIKWWETSESLGRERWSHGCQANTFHAIYFCLFWKMSEWIASRHFCSPYVKLSPVKLSKSLVAMEIVPKWLPRNAGTWLPEIESRYLNFHQYCVCDSLFIPLGRLHLKWSLWDVWTHQARIMLTSPRGTQRGLVFILGSIWCSGMITAVSHHPVLSCLGCYARATHRCIQGTLLTFLSI